MKRWMKRLLICGTALFLLGSCALAAINVYMIQSVKDRIVTAGTAKSLEADCILVLGAGVHQDGSPSNMLEDRLLRGIELYDQGVAPKLLMSGDHGREDYDEVNVMKEFAKDHGVASEDIFMDHAGFSTYESMYRAREVFQAEKIVVVTQKYHMYRAIYAAEKMGLEAYGVTSDQRTYAGQRRRDVRELLARAKDFATGILKPEPKYLGDAIPVSGNGNQTNDKSFSEESSTGKE